MRIASETSAISAWRRLSLTLGREGQGLVQRRQLPELLATCGPFQQHALADCRICASRVPSARRDCTNMRAIFEFSAENAKITDWLVEKGGGFEPPRPFRLSSKIGIESGGHSFSRGALYALLSNPIYVGEIRHKKLSHPGQHKAIVDRTVWERTRQQLQEHRVRTKSHDASPEKSPLIGRLVDENGDGLTPSHARKRERESTATASRATSRLKDSRRRVSVGGCLQEN